MQLLRLRKKKSANILLFLLIILVAITISWQLFFTSKLFISLVISSRDTCLKLKAYSLWFSNIITTLVCFLNLSIILKTGSSIWPTSVRSSWSKNMFIFFTMFEKKILNVSTTSRFSDKILSSLAKVMLPLLKHFFENIGFTIFQNILFSLIFKCQYFQNSCIFLSVKNWYNSFFVYYMQLVFQKLFFSERSSFFLRNKLLKLPVLFCENQI